MVGLIDGSLSTLAPIFGIVFYTHKPHTAFIAGLATSIGAAISMAFSEGLSDTGELTGRGSPVLRGAITGGGTFPQQSSYSVDYPQSGSSWDAKFSISAK